MKFNIPIHNILSIENKRISQLMPMATKFIFVGLSFLVLMGVGCFMGAPSYREIMQMVDERQQLSKELNSLKNFALRHNDYEAFRIGKFKELETLEQRLPEWIDSNQVQLKLQQLALKQKLYVSKINLLEATKKSGLQAVGSKEKDLTSLKSDSFQLEVYGDYFALLRFLKQIEKLQIKVTKLEIKGTSNKIVYANINVKAFYVLSL